MSKFTSMFAALDVETDVQTNPAVQAKDKKPAATKKPVTATVKPVAEQQPRFDRPPREEGQGEFTTEYAGESRGGRGGRGGARGGRGGRGSRGGFQNGGDRQDRGEYREDRGEYREGGRGGYRGGRGGASGAPRQYRPKTAAGVEGGEEGVATFENKEQRNFGHRGERHGFEGKPREHFHPYDRQDGTGRGQRAPKRVNIDEKLVYRKKGEEQPVVEGGEDQQQER